jgi:MerR family copper efflux transcriptional regulator
LALDHVGKIDAKIAALVTMRDAVQELADKCDGDDRPESPILRDLEGTAALPAK